MSPHDLDAFQTDFAAALFAKDPDARPNGLDREAADRFRVYRNNFFHGLGQQLSEAYPVVRRIVGEAFFLATASEFLAQHPPRTRSLALFGEKFPVFLAGFPPARSLPYLPDVARLERAWLEALHAADATPLTPANPSCLGSGLAEARFRPHPAARILTSAYPVVDLWRANQLGEDPGQRNFKASGQSALVTRPLMQVQIRELSPQQADFARSLFFGNDVAAAVERASTHAESFDVTVAFRDLQEAGAFESVTLPPASPLEHNDRSKMK